MSFLQEFPVDFLLIDMLDTAIWEKLLEVPSPAQRPHAIVVMGDPEDLTSECGLRGIRINTFGSCVPRIMEGLLIRNVW
jgi:hypothetical protein